MDYSGLSTAYNQSRNKCATYHSGPITNEASTQGHILLVSVSDDIRMSRPLTLRKIPHVRGLFYQHLHLLLHLDRLIRIAQEPSQLSFNLSQYLPRQR
jgi:hypothetical protein